MMAHISSFGLYLLATLFLSGFNHSVALSNNAAENIPILTEPEQSKDDRLELAIQSVMRAVDDGFARAALEVREVKEAVKSLEEKTKSSKDETQSLKEDIKFIKEDTKSIKEEVTSLKAEVTSLKAEVTSLKSEVTSLKEDMKSIKTEVTSLKEVMKSVEAKLSASSSCVEGQTPSTHRDLDPDTSDRQSLSEVSLAAETRLKADIGHAVDTFTSSVTRAADTGQTVIVNATSCPTESAPTTPAIPPSINNCYDFKQTVHRTSGLYSVTISGKEVQVYCDLVTDGGGWTVIQRRDDICCHVDFDRKWADYKRGFGDLNGEFWLGLDNIHRLTSDPSTPMRLRIDLEDWNGEKRVALYKTFRVGGEEDKYKLTVGGYNKGPGGDPGDAFTYYHNGNAFSTKDRDNDGLRGGTNCAKQYMGGWWYGGHSACHYSQLNGLYLKGTHDQERRGVYWYNWKLNNYHSLKRASMKIRPR